MIECLESRAYLAQATLYADFDPQLIPSLPVVSSANLGQWVVFSRATDAAGRELWRSDGSPGGTRMVRDICSGVGSSLQNSTAMASLGDSVIFAADDGVHGAELWRTDGTPAGTYMIADLAPGDTPSHPKSFQVCDGKLYFSAQLLNASGYQLFVTDGTSTGTRQIAPSLVKSMLDVVGTANHLLFFTGNPPTGGLGAELWVTDGTDSGTYFLKDIYAGTGSSNISNGIEYDGALFFSALDSAHGYEMWRSDGTPGGTLLVKDMRPGTPSGGFGAAVILSGKLYFIGSTATTGVELCVTDGTDAGTQVLLDLNPGAASSSITWTRVVNGHLFFYGNAGNGIGTELWSTDGTGEGTVLVKDINPGSKGSLPIDGWAFMPIVLGNKLYFAATDGVHGTEAWSTDGTATVMLSDLVADQSDTNGPLFFASQNDALLFTQFDPGIGSRLWSYDVPSNTHRDLGLFLRSNPPSYPTKIVPAGQGVFALLSSSSTGTELIFAGPDTASPQWIDVYPGPTSSSPTSVTAFGGGICFTADDGVHGRELWFSDGTLSGTRMVRDLVAGTEFSAPYVLGIAGNMLYFIATTPSAGAELWRTDGTAAGTIMLKDIAPGPGDGVSTPIATSEYNGMFIFTASDGSLWKSDGTPAGTQLISTITKNITSIAELHGVLYFNGGTDTSALYRTDGTAEGTWMVSTLGPYKSTTTSTFCSSRDWLYFVAVNSMGTASTLWRSDGTASGTTRVVDLEYTFMSLQSLVAVGQSVFFIAKTADLGTEVWRSDGTASGTKPLADLLRGFNSSLPSQLISADGNAFFVEGGRVWSAEGSSGAYRRVRIRPENSFNPAPDFLSARSGRLYFVAEADFGGVEVLSIGTADLTPPAAQRAEYQDDARQQVRYDFSEFISPFPAADQFTLLNVTTGEGRTFDSVSITAKGRSVVARANSRLQDGNYVARLPAGGVADPNGNYLQADADVEFFVLNGDANHDRHVDTQDFNLLAGSFGGSGKVFSQGNFDYDPAQTIDSIDFNILLVQFGKTLSPPVTPFGVQNGNPLFGSLDIDSEKMGEISHKLLL